MKLTSLGTLIILLLIGCDQSDNNQIEKERLRLRLLRQKSDRQLKILEQKCREEKARQERNAADQKKREQKYRQEQARQEETWYWENAEMELGFLEKRRDNDLAVLDAHIEAAYSMRKITTGQYRDLKNQHNDMRSNPLRYRHKELHEEYLKKKITKQQYEEAMTQAYENGKQRCKRLQQQLPLKK